MKEIELKVVQQSVFSSMSYFLKNSLIEMKRRFCYFLLSLVSIIVVVCAAQITQTITDKSQLIYLQSGELAYGQIDMKFTTNIDYIYIPFYKNRYEDKSTFNFTQVQKRLELLGLENQISPRIVFDLNITLVSQQGACVVDSSTPLSSFPEIFNYCPNQKDSELIFIDTEKERNIGLGRSFDLSEIPEDQIVINQELADEMQLKEGSTVLFSIKPNIYYFYGIQTFCWFHFDGNEQNCQTSLTNFEHYQFDTYISAKVAKIIDKNVGKESFNTMKKAAFMEFKYLYKLLNKHANQQLKYYFPLLQYYDNLFELDPYQHTAQMVLNLPNRVDFYTKQNMDQIEIRGNFIASEIIRILGVYPVSINLPILKLFHDLKYAQMFLSVVTNMIILLFSSLSIMMLYNLLLVSVETKTYELGVLRIIGLNKVGVVIMILSQSLSFVIPGVIIGILLATQILAIASVKAKEIVGLDISNSPSINSYGLCLFLGLFIPLASSIIPIKSALSNSLSFALDKDRSKSSAVKITVDLDGKNTNWGQISFGLLCSLFGFSIYYLLPLSLFTLDMSMLITIFFFILIGLLVGLILVSINFSYLFEKLVVYVCLFWISASSQKLVLKNLTCHRIKNTRTSIMYGLSIAFVVFVWSAMSLQIDSQYYQVLLSFGANYCVLDNFNGFKIDSYENMFSSDLKEYIRSYTMVTQNIEQTLQDNGVHGQFRIKNKGQTLNLRTRVLALQPNYLQTTYKQFLKIEQKSSSGLDIVQELYSSQEVGKIIISKQLAEQLFYSSDVNLDEGSNENYVFLEFTDGKQTVFNYQFQVSSIVSSFPGINMQGGGLSSLDQEQNVIISIPAFQQILESIINKKQTNIYDRMIIDADLENELIIKSKLRAASNYQLRYIWSFKGSSEELEQNMKLINISFSGLGGLVMLLCFFSLISSMTANIYDQSKEIAIMRAVGLSKLKLSLIYIYESFVLVFSSCIIGTIVGMVIGYSMSMQRQLFTQMAVNFRFPKDILLSQFVISIICAFASTIMPIIHLLRQPVSSIIRKVF
ncbi:efflux ABC transporter, permease domain protein (macronuclear) [Tetrahymena thermophila SB210]|uniref:Efflux ABC transporter, permease domain protein n=1 Tax=Tetrahymena thermophila (strain SB210) TaxID=312017 RepID=Q237B0_TETTS|nr:efflux ABC transporter, permease domain protein [Tetrahymena thermophila SB210]EAR92340.1 efflux ABC transporter, permease domain protein [Tetrahymena thermophila SB210]|eukprot:XP_001012585.1 efflux ABC transporter, permease domain protein [Tetrahymena thermophila SB210]